MKRRLNRDGIAKVLEYLGNDGYSNGDVDGLGSVIKGVITSEDIDRLKHEGIITEHVGLDLHKVFHLCEDDDQPIENRADIEIPDNMEEMVSLLSSRFPTREEVNDALQRLKDSMIDPEEMLNNLKIQMKSLKKQARTDEI